MKNGKELTIIQKKLDEITPYKNNPRKNDSAVAPVAESIKAFGFKVPIVVDRDGVIVNGHTRYKAAKLLGMKSVPCILADDLTPGQIKAFRLADNRTAEFASWDIDMLTVELGELAATFDMKDFGFPEVDVLTPDAGSNPDVEDDNESDDEKDSPIRLLNLETAQFEGEGRYGIPVIMPETYSAPKGFIPFSDAKTAKQKDGVGVHCFVDDYRFARAWNNPAAQIPVLRDFACVASPDFSLYMNMPKALQIFNHYRKHWCAAYWQMNGIHVLPTIAWSDEESFSWCFDGEPKDAPVIVSTVGVMADETAKKAFITGYNAMMEALHPPLVLCYGAPPDGLTGNIEILPTFSQNMKVRIKGNKQ